MLEHSDIFRTPYLYAGSDMHEFRELNYFGARWYAPPEQMLYGPDPGLVDRSGMVPADVQNAFRAALAGPTGKPDPAKVRQFNALVQQVAGQQLETNATSRLVAKIAANPKSTLKSAFKAFATYSAKPAVEINLSKTPDGFKLKTIKVAPFLLKQFTVKKGKP